MERHKQFFGADVHSQSIAASQLYDGNQHGSEEDWIPSISLVLGLQTS